MSMGVKGFINFFKSLPMSKPYCSCYVCSGADLELKKGGKGTAHHSGENLKVTDIHDLLINIRYCN